MDERKDAQDWEVWVAGDPHTGQEGSATFHGIFNAETFREAVEIWKASLPPAGMGGVNLNEMLYFGAKICGSRDEAIGKRAGG